MVARPIHNLKVPGSNPEVGYIFSERYLEKWERERETERERQKMKCGGIAKEGGGLLEYANTF